MANTLTRATLGIAMASVLLSGVVVYPNNFGLPDVGAVQGNFVVSGGSLGWIDTKKCAVDAGVEAIEINDRVRVIAQTSFEDDPAGVRVDGVVLKAPYVIDAIGSPSTLSGALSFDGGDLIVRCAQ